ncbi:hypothetical protein BAUCODRAFT_23366 [Baudoinia panamericana UAMH 10762]|uniref:Uncharacterized protein n=1 Tax=Baudoinia panamericana (strain UAMH 10762) TaxID=717646 RepID=M2NCP1_BAUPA|nr:uncharacterized protein BAUCODRAFT_23366 [Baudoinia panamericana UAMH 10762]EMC96949.1 hypothetical protein BAUCODRAFT_23366 [Baudoinia panamericana UAMH 10762]
MTLEEVFANLCWPPTRLNLATASEEAHKGTDAASLGAGLIAESHAGDTYCSKLSAENCPDTMDFSITRSTTTAATSSIKEGCSCLRPACHHGKGKANSTDDQQVHSVYRQRFHQRQPTLQAGHCVPQHARSKPYRLRIEDALYDLPGWFGSAPVDGAFTGYVCVAVSRTRAFVKRC